MASTKPRAVGRMGDEAVAAKTGRVWEEWFTLLDADGAHQWPHKQIAAHLVERYELSGWWAQSVTVEYERARGLRDMYQKTDGYSASASRTINVPIEVLFQAVDDPARRAAWLYGLDITVRRSTPNRSLRISVADGTNLDIAVYAKGEHRAQITIQHDKLPDAESVTRLKAYWSDALDRLKASLVKES